jgi:D-aspartate ligase
MRDLKRHGIETHCVDCDGGQQGFRTVYGKAHLCPNPDTEPAAWARFMISLSRQIGGRPVLISSADQFVTAIATHAATLEPHYTFRPAAVARQALLATKERQYEIAGQNGLPVPRTATVRSLEELLEVGRTARFPCLVKPLHARQWERFPRDHPLWEKKLAHAASIEELEAKYRLAQPLTPSMVVQEIIQGPDDAKVVYLSCYGRGSQRLGALVVRELRTCPMNFGSASVVIPIHDPETDALCDGFLRKLGYEGLCELELKRDSRDGQVRLIEINPRYSGTSDAAPYAGVELGWLYYLDLIGETVTPMEWNGRVFHHVTLRRDVRSFREYMAAGLATWSDILKPYRSGVFFDFDPRDWRLTVASIFDVCKILVHPYVRRVFPKRAPPVS